MPETAGVCPMASSRLPQASDEPVGGTGEPSGLGGTGTADLLLQRVEDDLLRLRRLPGLDQGRDQLALRGGERDADPAQRRDPLDRLLQRLAELGRRGAEVLAEHGREVLRQRERTGEGVAGDRAEGGEDGRRVLDALGGGERAPLQAVGECR